MKCLIGVFLTFVGGLMFVTPLKVGTIENIHWLVCIAGLGILFCSGYILYDYLENGEQ